MRRCAWLMVPSAVLMLPLLTGCAAAVENPAMYYFSARIGAVSKVFRDEVNHRGYQAGIRSLAERPYLGWCSELHSDRVGECHRRTYRTHSKEHRSNRSSRPHRGRQPSSRPGARTFRDVSGKKRADPEVSIERVRRFLHFEQMLTPIEIAASPAAKRSRSGG
jgi:hypothetical protein